MAGELIGIRCILFPVEQLTWDKASDMYRNEHSSLILNIKYQDGNPLPTNSLGTEDSNYMLPNPSPSVLI